MHSSHQVPNNAWKAVWIAQIADDSEVELESLATGLTESKEAFNEKYTESIYQLLLLAYDSNTRESTFGLARDVVLVESAWWARKIEIIHRND